MNLMRISTEAIHIGENRQRKDLGDLNDLQASIQANGQLQPIVIKRLSAEPGNYLGDYLLVAGERRLRACRNLNIRVLAIDFGDLSPLQQQIIELEENVKRKDLSWQERADAIRKIHDLHVAENPAWTQTDTAKQLGVTQESISQHLTVAKAIAADPKVAEASGFSAAKNMLSRKNARELGSVLEGLLYPDLEEKKADLPDPVLCGSFLDFAESYSGPRFNLLHCDFPYGVGMHENALQDTRVELERYEDSEETYWDLVNCLIRNASKLLADEAHVFFWFSMEYYHETVAALSEIGKVNKFPLVWHKSDNTGLLPDPQRGPRRVYETGLLVSRGDRKIVRPVSNCVSLPAAKDSAEHLSEKPVNVLLHFFSMLVDETTRLLDPTAGSGTSLIAAKKLGAKSVQGIELNQGFADIANKKFWRET